MRRQFPWLGQYVLDERGDAVPETNLLKWGKWLETHDRRVAVTRFAWGMVSTVFLGLDHNFNPMDDPLTYKPVLWETMAFGGPLDQKQWRYDSREAALAGHREMVEQCKARAQSEDDRIAMEMQGIGNRE